MYENRTTKGLLHFVENSLHAVSKLLYVWFHVVTKLPSQGCALRKIEEFPVL